MGGELQPQYQATDFPTDSSMGKALSAVPPFTAPTDVSAQRQ